MSEVKTKRWNDPIEAADGTRLLVTRYRPRGLAKADEAWSEWLPAVAPSVALHAAAYGKAGLKIAWEGYRVRYLSEMRTQREAIAALATRVANGETLTLLCSAQCERESRCHRSLLKTLIETAMQAKP